MFPSSRNYQFDKLLKFRMFPKVDVNKKINFPCMNYSENKDSFVVDFERVPDCKIASLYDEKEVKYFEIENRYKHHNKEFLNHIDKHLRYPASFFRMYVNATHQNSSTLYQDIFNVNIRNEERQIFQKIYNDIDEIFL